MGTGKFLLKWYLTVWLISSVILPLVVIWPPLYRRFYTPTGIWISFFWMISGLVAVGIIGSVVAIRRLITKSDE